MKKIYCLFLLMFAVTFARAQNINKIINKSYVDYLIKTLSSDQMQGRRTFTLGIDKAASFIENEFKQIGLKPLTGQSGFRQTFYRYQFKPATVNISIDGKTMDQDNVFVFGNQTEETSFSGSAEGWIKLNPGKDFNSQYQTIIQTNKRQLVLVDVKFVDAFNRLRTITQKNVTMDQAELNKTKNNPIVFVLDVDTVEKSYNVNIKSNIVKLPLFNVAGMLPGKTRAKEIVIFSAHYDHLGIVKTYDRDSIMNGADDDASGTAAIIALAKYYKAYKKNNRTLIFIAFTAEEIGGFGSRYFSEQLNPDDVAAMFNIEMIGKESKFGKNAAFITGYEYSDFGKILQKNLKGTDFKFYPDPYPDLHLFYRSDNATLAALGVAAHTISTDKIDIDPFYHTVRDEYETLDMENILFTIKAIAKSATSIVKATDTPTRISK